MKKALAQLSFLHLLNDGYSAAILLLLPFIAEALSLQLTQVGFLGTLVHSLSALLALPAAYIARRHGGMRTLVAAAACYALGFCFAGVARGFWGVGLAFVCVGAGCGLFHPISLALVVKHSERASQGRVMGNFTAIGDIGRVGISSLITWVVALAGWRWAAIGAGGLVLLALGGLLWSQEGAPEHAGREGASPHRPWKELMANTRFTMAVLANALDSMGGAAILIFLPFLFLSRGVTAATLGAFTSTFFVGNLAGKAILGRFVDRFRSDRVFVVAEFSMAVVLVCLAYSQSVWVMVALSAVLGILAKGTAPVVVTMISESVAHRGSYEQAFGVNSLATSCGNTLAAVLMGWISERWGIAAAFLWSSGIVCLAAVPALIYGRARIFGQTETSTARTNHVG